MIASYKKKGSADLSFFKISGSVVQVVRGYSRSDGYGPTYSQVFSPFATFLII